MPKPNDHLSGFALKNSELAALSQHQTEENIATIAMDATLVETNKAEALYCYKGFPSYQPINTWWAEQGIILHTEFRDGNVPAGYEQLKVFIEALECLPAWVKQVRLDSDTAGNGRTVRAAGAGITAGASVSNHGDAGEEVQAVWDCYEYGLGWRGVDSLASRALW